MGRLGSLRFEFAVGIKARARGLLSPAVCKRGEVLVLIPCKSIHTFGMTDAIDVAFVDRRGHVLEATRGLPPNRLRYCRGAVCVLERRSAFGDSWFEKDEAIGLMV
jgi:uncharacterized membrane protein (UPF0127 family)